MSAIKKPGGAEKGDRSKVTTERARLSIFCVAVLCTPAGCEKRPAYIRSHPGIPDR